MCEIYLKNRYSEWEKILANTLLGKALVQTRALSIGFYTEKFDQKPKINLLHHMTQVNTVRAWLERARTQTTHDSFGHILFDNFLMFFLVPFGHDSFEVLMLSKEGF